MSWEAGRGTMAEEKLKTVHDDDLEDVLRRLGVFNDFVGDRLKCAFCEDVITWDNLHSLFPDSGAVKCSCSKPDCINQMLLAIGGFQTKE
jgi:hypothetical protein